jgi:hypothetical protein
MSTHATLQQEAEWQWLRFHGQVKARKRPLPQRAATHRDRTKYDRKRTVRQEREQ